MKKNSYEMIITVGRKSNRFNQEPSFLREGGSILLLGEQILKTVPWYDEYT